MLLNKKIHASSIAEVVIALTIIALCFGIASLVFIRSTKTATNFQSTRQQTEVQCMIWKQMQLNALPEELEEIETTEEQDELEDSLISVKYIALDNSVIWNQQRIKYD